MKSNIIAFAGKAQGGKNTLSNFLHGCQMKAYSVIDEFFIDNDGNLIIQKNNDAGEKELGKLDVTRNDFSFGEWASVSMWPLVKNYAFATELKEMGINLFNIPRYCAYGTDEQKNEKMPHLLWENMPGVITEKDMEYMEHDNKILSLYNIRDLRLYFHESGSMSAREWMQFFGTEIGRKMYSDVWTNRTLKNIENEEPQLAIISDCRFENECLAIKSVGGKIIKLTRNEDSKAKHLSENAFGDFTDFDAIIDNKNMNVEESTKELLSILSSWNL